MKKAETVSADELATWCSLSRRRVDQLYTDGVFTRNKKGEYLLQKNIAAYIEYLRSSKEQTDDAKRLDKAKADKAEIEVARLNIEYGPISMLQATLDNVIGVLVNALDAFPKTVSLKLIGIPSQPEVEHILVTELDKLRKDMAAPDLYEMADGMMEKERARKSKHTPH